TRPPRRFGNLPDPPMYGKHHFARFGDLTQVDLLITDTGLGSDDALAIESLGTEVVRA
ncbi:D-beta-D-heptose 1-phosphate adenosyltransferase, partial [Streptomyces sp. NPDC059802]